MTCLYLVEYLLQIGAECYKSLQEHILGEIAGKLRSYESLMVNQLMVVKNKVDVECAKLVRITDMLAACTKACSEKSFDMVSKFILQSSCVS